MPLPKLERTAKTKAKAKATKGGRSGWEEYPAASMSDATGSDTDGPETAPTVTCGGATRADAVAPSAQTRADRLWKFDWSVPSVVKSGLRGEGAILDAAAGELEMRLNTAKVMLHACACSQAVPHALAITDRRGYYRHHTGASAHTRTHKAQTQALNTADELPGRKCVFGTARWHRCLVTKHTYLISGAHEIAAGRLGARCLSRRRCMR